jgi:hypothetical protein
MTDTDKLKAIIEDLASLGDELSESLEIIENDPVINAYLWKVSNLAKPLWMKDSDPTSTKLRQRWDDKIGFLQREGLYQQQLMNMDAATELVYEAQPK